MTQQAQAEALRLRLAAEQHIAICKKYGADGLTFDPAPEDVIAVLDRLAQLEAQQAVQSPGWKLVPIEPTREMLAAGDQKTWVLPSLDCYTAMLAAAPTPPVQELKPQCWCTTCRPQTLEDMRFVVCPECGNKRCPRAHNHELACTDSNDPGQKGSSWEHVKPAKDR